MSLVNINWTPDAKELRKFGLAMIVGFGLIGAFLYFGLWPLHAASPRAGTGCWIFGGVAGLLGLSGTKIALPVYWAWMGVAFVMGNIVSRVILALIFFCVLTPVALLGRLVGRDKLLLRKPHADTYWRDASVRTEKRSYRRQF